MQSWNETAALEWSVLNNKILCTEHYKEKSFVHTAPEEFSTSWKFTHALRCYVHAEPPDPFKVRCEQSENIERFRVNEVSGHIFQPVVENSTSAVWI